MKKLQHKFVEFIPDSLAQNTLYVSIEYCTAVHKCACGCGNEVVTPLSPTDWELIFNGKTISLNPSIGNWGFPCRSHYWITRGEIIWAPPWSKKRINEGRLTDQLLKKEFYGSSVNVDDNDLLKSKINEAKSSFSTFWSKVRGIF